MALIKDSLTELKQSFSVATLNEFSLVLIVKQKGEQLK
jgi:hypothetical protein